jgi:hypothetical protein
MTSDRTIADLEQKTQYLVKALLDTTASTTGLSFEDERTAMAIAVREAVADGERNDLWLQRIALDAVGRPWIA